MKRSIALDPFLPIKGGSFIASGKESVPIQIPRTQSMFLSPLKGSNSPTGWVESLSCDAPSVYR